MLYLLVGIFLFIFGYFACLIYSVIHYTFYKFYEPSLTKKQIAMDKRFSKDLSLACGFHNGDKIVKKRFKFSLFINDKKITLYPLIFRQSFHYWFIYLSVLVLFIILAILLTTKIL